MPFDDWEETKEPDPRRIYRAMLRTQIGYMWLGFFAGFLSGVGALWVTIRP